MGKYDDIIDMEQPIDPKHPRMSLHNRAAQFAPFSALTGFSGKIHETARLTQTKAELSEDAKEALNRKLRQIAEKIKERPVVTVTYFVPDKTKEGGSYRTLTASVMKIDLYRKTLLLDDVEVIAFDDLLEITDDNL